MKLYKNHEKKSNNKKKKENFKVYYLCYLNYIKKTSGSAFTYETITYNRTGFNSVQNKGNI